MNWLLLQNSLIVAGVVGIAATAAGFLAALCAIAMPRPTARTIMALAVTTLALPPFLATNCWLDLLGGNGLLRPWIPLSIFSLPGTVLVLSLLLWPLPFLLIWAPWQKIETPHLEVDPALRGLRLIVWLLWPAARPAAAIALAITFVLALNNFAVPSLLQVKVLPAEVWIAFNTNLDALAAFQASWPMLVTPLLLVFCLQWSSFEWPRQQQTAAPLALRRQLGAMWVLPLCVFTLALLLASVALPCAQLVIAPRTWSEFIPATVAGAVAIGNSTLYAGLAAFVTLTLGLLLSRMRWPAGLWLIFLVPGVLLGVGLASGFNRPWLSWFYHTPAVVIAVLVLRYLAFGWAAGRVALRDADRDLIDIARMEGASGWKLFWHAQWPQVAPQSAIAAYAVYLLCLWDVESLIIVVPPGGETLALRIFNLLHYGHNAHVNALCVLMLGLALAPLLVWQFGRRLLRK